MNFLALFVIIISELNHVNRDHFAGAARLHIDELGRPASLLDLRTEVHGSFVEVVVIDLHVDRDGCMALIRCFACDIIISFSPDLSHIYG